jgi:hypothetical protein
VNGDDWTLPVLLPHQYVTSHVSFHSGIFQRIRSLVSSLFR